MIDQTFSAKNFLRLTTRLDPKKYRLGKNRIDYLNSLEKISEVVLKDDFTFSTFSRSIRSGKPVYSATNHIDEFVVRKLNDNVRRIYGVKQSNRTEIIQQVILLLQEQVPLFLLRLDVKSFYESIDRNAQLKKINDSPDLAYRNKRLLNDLLETTKYFPGIGLPRGLSISATLSEIYMQDFDNAVRKLDGVYFYARYVDDIIIFSYLNSSETRTRIEAILPTGMEFNLQKEKHFEFNKNGNYVGPDKNPEMSYLGYRFIFRPQSVIPKHDLPKGSTPPPPRLTIKISENKLAKMRRRLMLSFFDYIKNHDYGLLVARLKFLTGNCRMKRDKDNGRLLSGIFYNYSHIGEAGVEDLKALTAFLQRAVFSKKGSFGSKLSSLLSITQRKYIGSLCFRAGFEKRILHNLSAKRLQQIKRCWQHV